jgi:hypothetical protein
VRRIGLLVLVVASAAGCAAPPVPSGTPSPAPSRTPSPAPIGATLTVHASGRLQGLSPMGVGAALVIQPELPRPSEDPVWELGPDDKIVFESTFDDASNDFVIGEPHDPPRTIAPGRYRVGGLREIYSDVSSEPVPGERERVVTSCSDFLVVEPSTTSVRIDATFPGGDRCDLEIVTD